MDYPDNTSFVTLYPLCNFVHVTIFNSSTCYYNMIKSD